MGQGREHTSQEMLLHKVHINNGKVVGKNGKYKYQVPIKTELIAENCREEQKLSPIKPHICRKMLHTIYYKPLASD